MLQSLLVVTSKKAWSAPSAIGTAGVGVGGQIGAEMTDFLVVLNSRAVSKVSSNHAIPKYLIAALCRPLYVVFTSHVINSCSSSLRILLWLPVR